jgi:hypothetical protein
MAANAAQTTGLGMSIAVLMLTRTIKAEVIMEVATTDPTIIEAVAVAMKMTEDGGIEHPMK